MALNILNCFFESVQKALIVSNMELLGYLELNSNSLVDMTECIIIGQWTRQGRGGGNLCTCGVTLVQSSVT